MKKRHYIHHQPHLLRHVPRAGAASTGYPRHSWAVRRKSSISGQIFSTSRVKDARTFAARVSHRSSIRTDQYDRAFLRTFGLTVCAPRRLEASATTAPSETGASEAKHTFCRHPRGVYGDSDPKHPTEIPFARKLDKLGASPAQPIVHYRPYNLDSSRGIPQQAIRFNSLCLKGYWSDLACHQDDETGFPIGNHTAPCDTGSEAKRNRGTVEEAVHCANENFHDDTLASNISKTWRIAIPIPLVAKSDFKLDHVSARNDLPVITPDVPVLR